MNDIEWINDEDVLESKGNVYIPFLDQEINVTVDLEDDEENLTEHQKCSLEAFLNLKKRGREYAHLEHLLALHCHHICWENNPLSDKPRSHIWNLIEVTTLHVPIHEDTESNYIIISGRCSWDEEHGFEVVFKNEYPLIVLGNEYVSGGQAWFNRYIDL